VKKYKWVQVLEDGVPGHQGITTICRELNRLKSEISIHSLQMSMLLKHFWQILGEAFGRISYVDME
jgi:hypothetical protein